jgi:hypothetical protein
MKEILSCVNYKTYQWHICGDLNVNVTVEGLQKDYTKFCCIYANGIIVPKAFATARRTVKYT